MADLVNVTQAAKLLGTSRVTVTAAIKKKILTVATRDGGPKMDPDVITAEWAKYKGYSDFQSHHDEGGGNKGGRPPNFGEPMADSGDGTKLSDREKLLKWKAEQAKVKALRDEMELQRKRGELIDIESVKKQGAQLGSILMGALAALPYRLSQQFAVMSDPHDIHAALENEVNRLIEEIRKQCGYEAGEVHGETDEAAGMTG